MPGEGDGGEASAELRPQAKRAACRKPRATPLKRARAGAEWASVETPGGEARCGKQWQLEMRAAYARCRLSDFLEVRRQNDRRLAERLHRIKKDEDVVGRVESLGDAFVRHAVPVRQ